MSAASRARAEVLRRARAMREGMVARGEWRGLRLPGEGTAVAGLAGARPRPPTRGELAGPARAACDGCGRAAQRGDLEEVRTRHLGDLQLCERCRERWAYSARWRDALAAGGGRR